MTERPALEQTDVRDATHVNAGNGQIEKIISKWGILDDGCLARPSVGGFGVITEAGQRVDMFTAHSYWREV